MRGVVDAASARCRYVTDEANRRARYAHADRDFRADAAQFEQTRQFRVAQRRTLVSTVVTHGRAGQTIADGDRQGRCGARW